MSFLLLYVQTDKQQVGYAEFLSACHQKENERRGRFRPKKKKIDDGDQLVRVSAYLQWDYLCFCYVMHDTNK